MIYKEFEKRIQDLSRPDRKAIKEEVFAGFEDFVGTKAEIDAREAELEANMRDLIRKAEVEHRKQANAIKDEFKAALSREYGTEIQEIDDRIYGHAWDEGHSSGLSDVENYYEDYAELASFAYEKGLASK